MEGGPPIFRQNYTCSALLKNNSNHLPVRDYHPLWSPFPKRSGLIKAITGLVRVRSPLLTESRLISFPPGTEMFQFPGFAPITYEFSYQYTLRCGFPHSDMFGSMSARNSPNLIAACYVLHRLSVPRHPPNALVMLDPYQKPDLFGANMLTYPTRSRDIFNLRHWLTTLIYTRTAFGAENIEKRLSSDMSCLRILRFWNSADPKYNVDKTTFILYRSILPYESTRPTDVIIIKNYSLCPRTNTLRCLTTLSCESVETVFFSKKQQANHCRAGRC